MSNMSERLRAIARLQRPGTRVILDRKEVKPQPQLVRDPFSGAPEKRRRGQQSPEGRMRLRESMLARRRDPDFEVRRLATFRKTMARKRAERAK